MSSSVHIFCQNSREILQAWEINGFLATVDVASVFVGFKIHEKFQLKKNKRPRGGQNSIGSPPSVRTNDQIVRGFVMRFCLITVPQKPIFCRKAENM